MDNKELLVPRVYQALMAQQEEQDPGARLVLAELLDLRVSRDLRVLLVPQVSLVALVLQGQLDPLDHRVLQDSKDQEDQPDP